MRSVTYSMGVSLDGYIVGPDGGFGWTAPDEEVFRFVTDEIRPVGVHLLGRRLYETMLYWETADQDPSLDASMLEWAALWKALPKVVFSTTLPAVQGHARLASGGLAEEIGRLRAEPGGGRHRDRRCGSRRRGGRIGSDRRVPGQGLPGTGWRWHCVLSPARAPGGSRANRDPHLQLGSRLPPLPRGALAGWCQRGGPPDWRQHRQADPQDRLLPLSCPGHMSRWADTSTSAFTRFKASPAARPAVRAKERLTFKAGPVFPPGIGCQPSSHEYYQNAVGPCPYATWAGCRPGGWIVSLVT